MGGLDTSRYRGPVHFWDGDLFHVQGGGLVHVDQGGYLVLVIQGRGLVHVWVRGVSGYLQDTGVEVLVQGGSLVHT